MIPEPAAPAQLRQACARTWWAPRASREPRPDSWTLCSFGRLSFQKLGGADGFGSVSIFTEFKVANRWSFEADRKGVCDFVHKIVAR